MSYAGISIREALDKLNAPNSGWYLPQVQRQYVWGGRHESESYICLLLDSLLKKYPIGGIVLWETQHEVPYRCFLGDYAPGHYEQIVDKGRWGAHKFLVYDGQQRLQTLNSVLRHRFNGRLLHYDLLFDPTKSDADETGFLFRDPEAPNDLRYLRMTELFSLTGTVQEKVRLEQKLLSIAGLDENEQLILRQNLGALWGVFVELDHKSIAYFSVRADTPAEVNEVFRRLNTGGIALTQLELILGRIKSIYHDYEERLWNLSEQIESRSGGIEFSSTEILQLFHLIIKETIRIDEERLNGSDLETFERVLKNDTEPVLEFFSAYLREIFNINHASIVPRWAAVLPIIAYLVERKRSRLEWRVRALPSSELRSIHQYFLLSQFCDWNTQTMVNSFARLAMEAGRSGQAFPLSQIRQIAVEKNRVETLHEYQLLSQPWFAAKILMEHRSYVFHDKKPQMDHIFPMNLRDREEGYQEVINVLWNFQPMPAGVNNYKRARHPGEFFNSDDGAKYWSSYDFVPPQKSPLWEDYREFIAYRKGQMLQRLTQLYGLSVTIENQPTILAP